MKLLSLCFTAPQDNKNYIFHVPLELFPPSFIYKRPQLCKVHLQSCLAKKSLNLLHCSPVSLETNPCASPALGFMRLHDYLDGGKGFGFDTRFAVPF